MAADESRLSEMGGEMTPLKLLYQWAKSISPEIPLPNGLLKVSSSPAKTKPVKTSRHDLERLDAAQAKRERKATKRRNQHE